MADRNIPSNQISLDFALKIADLHAEVNDILEYRALAVLAAAVRAAQIHTADQCSAVETSRDAEDAAKWRALRNCARMTAMGSAGLGPEKAADDYAHVTLNFWTGVTGGAYDGINDAWAREWLDLFVAKALRGSPVKADAAHMARLAHASAAGRIMDEFADRATEKT